MYKQKDIIESAALGDLKRMQEACEQLHVKDLSRVRGKLEISKERLEKVKAKYRPSSEWNPITYIVGAGNIEVLKAAFKLSKYNIKKCLLGNGNHESCFCLLLTLHQDQTGMLSFLLNEMH